MKDQMEKQSKVLAILKKRIYFGGVNRTKLEDLKIAVADILDWADDEIEANIRQSNLALIDRLGKEREEMYITEAGKPYATGEGFKSMTNIYYKQVQAIPIEALDKLKKKLIKEEE